MEQDDLYKTLSIKGEEEIPNDFKVNDDQWQKISKEIPRVVAKVSEINSAVEDTIAFRSKVQQALLLRFYEITRAARREIEERGLQKIPLELLRRTTHGGYIVFTASGSVHYLEIVRRHWGYLFCKNYQRQSYYNLDISEQTRALDKVGEQDATFDAARITPLIRVTITDSGELDVFFGTQNDDDVEYKRAFTSTPAKEIFTSQDPSATGAAYTGITSSISTATQRFMNILKENPEDTSG